MGARDLLDDLARIGLTVTAESGRLIVRPASKLTDDLRVALRASKPELLSMLGPDVRESAGAEYRDTIRGESDEKFRGSIKRGREEPPQRPHALTEAEADLAHAKSWDEAACGRFVARVTLFIRRGVDATDADDLAERMHLRDVTGDDRVTCIDCSHHRLGAAEDCANSVNAGARVRGPDAATLLQRCPGFATAIDDKDRP